MQRILAIDAGGTSTRAVIADLDGTCRGFGLGAGGNPISSGVEGALDSLATATEAALRQAETSTTDSGRPGASAGFDLILIAMAGKSGGLPATHVSERLAQHAVHGPLELESDLLAMFCSGTPSADGYALAAGTGAVAARVRGHRLDRVAGGTGWLLGDDGSGFWIGHRIVRAVVAALDGLGPETALTPLLLEQLGLDSGRAGLGDGAADASGMAADSDTVEGRPGVLLPLLGELYRLRPVQLSRFAPLAFLAGDDEVARGILADGASALVRTLDAVREPGLDGPLVLGGSVLQSGMLAAGSPLADTLLARLGPAQPVSAQDGAVGAALLGLLHAGTNVDEALFERLTTTVAAARSRVALPPRRYAPGTPGA